MLSVQQKRHMLPASLVGLSQSALHTNWQANIVYIIVIYTYNYVRIRCSHRKSSYFGMAQLPSTKTQLLDPKNLRQGTLSL